MHQFMPAMAERFDWRYEMAIRTVAECDPDRPYEVYAGMLKQPKDDKWVYDQAFNRMMATE